MWVDPIQIIMAQIIIKKIKKIIIIITDGLNEPIGPDIITTTLNPIPATPNSIPAPNSSQTKGILNVFI